MNKKHNLIQEKSYNFALKSIELYNELIKQKEYVISKQFLRSATSIAANIEESLAAQSKKDFLHKMSIASKESRETYYWLRLLNDAKLLPKKHTMLIDDIQYIINILTKIVKTTMQNIKIQNST